MDCHFTLSKYVIRQQANLSSSSLRTKFKQPQIKCHKGKRMVRTRSHNPLADADVADNDNDGTIDLSVCRAGIEPNLLHTYIVRIGYVRRDSQRDVIIVKYDQINYVECRTDEDRYRPACLLSVTPFTIYVIVKLVMASSFHGHRVKCGLRAIREHVC
jgi:hypothetical protein